jgi:hypothetical protein
MSIRERYALLKTDNGLVDEGCDDSTYVCGTSSKITAVDQFKELVPKWKNVFETIDSEFPGNTFISDALRKLASVTPSSPEFSLAAAQKAVISAEKSIYSPSTAGKKRRRRTLKKKSKRRSRKSRRV